MINILLAILCSSLNILVFRYFDKKNIHSFQAIALNYITCVILGWLTLENNPSTEIFSESWIPYAVVIGSTFVYTFYLMALTTQRNGVSVAAVATKLSMVIPIVSAFFLYDDPVTTMKIAGILLAIAAVFFASIKKSANTSGFNYAVLGLPVLAWFVGGLIDSSVIYVENFHLGPGKYPIFLIFLFGTAAVNGLIILTVDYFKNPQKNSIKKSSLLGGLMLGIPNYGSIYFFLKALRHAGLDKSVVITVVSVGVVVFSSLAAWVLFKEKLSRLNLVGIALAIAAISLMTFA